MAKQLNLLDKSISPGRMIFLLAWPTIVEQVLMTIVSYVDTAMVGSIGVNATSAIAVNTSIIWLIDGFIGGVGVGFSVLVSKFIGEGRLEQAREVIRQSILSMVILGLAITGIVELILAPHLADWMGADAAIRDSARNYLFIVGSTKLFSVFLAVGGAIVRGTGDTRLPMVLNLINNLINIVLNFLFIYPSRTLHILGVAVRVWGAGLGVEGAAIGTAGSFAVSGTLMLLALFNKKSIVAITPKDHFAPNFKILRSVTSLAVPAILERVVLSSGQIIVTSLVTGIGNVALSAHHLANSAESICYMPVFGFSLAATTLVAQALGAGDKELAVTYAKKSVWYSLVMMVCTSVVLFVFAPYLIRIFIRDAAVIEMGASVLRIEAFVEPLSAIATVASGAFRGAGDTKWPFYISVIGMWVVRITLAAVLVKGFGMGLYGVWIPMALDWAVRGLLCLHHMGKERWLKTWKAEK